MEKSNTEPTVREPVKINPILGVTKPSEALRAMVIGIDKMIEEEDFVVDMETFGTSSSNGICYGCAATCAIQEMAGIRYSPYEISNSTRRSRKVGHDISKDELEDLEFALDRARTGDLHPLFRIFNLDQRELIPTSGEDKVGEPVARFFSRRWEIIHIDDWGDYRSEIVATIEEMEKLGY